MTLHERMILIFNKKRALRVVLFTPDKRVQQRIVVIKDNTFDIGEATYTVEPDKVHYFRGIPYLSYISDSIEAIDPNDLSKSSVSAEEYYSAINQNILLQIMRYATKGDQKLINMILLSGGATIAILGVAIYMLFNKVEELNIQLIDLQLLLEQIISMINTGGF